MHKYLDDIPRSISEIEARKERINALCKEFGIDAELTPGMTAGVYSWEMEKIILFLLSRLAEDRSILNNQPVKAV